MDIIKDIYKLDCYLNHEREEIYGFCLNVTCCQQPQFCFKCCQIIHQSHQKDCLRFTDITEILYELFQKLQSNKDQIQLIYKHMEVILILIKKRQSAQICNEEKQIENSYNYIKLIENQLRIVETQLQVIINLLQIKNYGEMRNQIRIIKNLYQFSQNKINFFTQILLDINDFFKIIKTQLEINLRLGYKQQQITKTILEQLKETVYDQIIYNIDFTNSRIIKDYSLKQVELISQPIQFIDQFVQTQTEKSFNFFEHGLSEDDSSQFNEIPQENDYIDESEIFQSKQQNHTQPSIEIINNNNLNHCQDIITFNQLNLQFILIVNNIQQQGGIIKWIYNINEYDEFQYFDSSGEQISDIRQEFNNEQIIHQPVQIDLQITNREQNNLTIQEQNQFDIQLFYQVNQMFNVEQYHNQMFQNQDEIEIINQDLHYEEVRIIEVNQIH